MEKFISNSEEQTFEYAKKYAQSLKGGEIIALTGELGAGKTAFAKGLAAGLGVKDTVTSPTFVIMKLYPAAKKNINKFCHIDAYRIQGKNDIQATGAEDYLGSQDIVSVLEWPENIQDATIDYAYRINIEHKSQNQRMITIK